MVCSGSNWKKWGATDWGRGRILLFIRLGILHLALKWSLKHDEENVGNFCLC